MIEEGAGDSHQFALGGRVVGKAGAPEVAADEGEGVGDGGAVLAVPGGLAHGGAGVGAAPLGEQGDAGEEVEQGGPGAGDGQGRPLALGLRAKVAANLREGSPLAASAG